MATVHTLLLHHSEQLGHFKAGLHIKQDFSRVSDSPDCFVPISVAFENQMTKMASVTAPRQL